MTNQEFLQTIACAFITFLKTGSRSNEKLKILHGAIADDIYKKIGNSYTVSSLGLGDEKEATIEGRYFDKKVDIVIQKNKSVIAGIGVKFVMQNYSQNSNNYFENMLGETANIRSNNVPYFQIFIVPDRLPYYNNEGIIQNWEGFSTHNAKKYLALSKDNFETMAHTPTKTLLFVIHLPDVPDSIIDKNGYKQHYESMEFTVEESEEDYGNFSNSVVYNDYEDFIQKVASYIEFIG